MCALLISLGTVFYMWIFAALCTISGIFEHLTPVLKNSVWPTPCCTVSPCLKIIDMWMLVDIMNTRYL